MNVLFHLNLPQDYRYIHVTYFGCSVHFMNLFICAHESLCAIRLRRRSGSGEEKGLSSAATLTRRRSSIPAKSPLTQQAQVSGLDSEDALRSSHLSPHRYSRSPGGSPSRSKHRSRGSPKQMMTASSETPVIKVRSR
jgi:hypothetical protein